MRVPNCALADGHFEVRCGGAPATDVGALEDAPLHCSGATVDNSVWQQVEPACSRGPAGAHEVGALYDGFESVGLQYGPGYRTLMHAWVGINSSLARLRVRSTHEGTQVHPADLDDALCMSALIPSGGGGGETRLPFAVDEAMLQGAEKQLWAVRHAWRMCPSSPHHA